MGGSQSVPYKLERMDGKVVVVTGANTGLGLASCKALAKLGAHVVMACRSKEKGEEALREVQKCGKAELRLLDLADLDSVDNFVDEIKKSFSQIDVLLNNAGIMMCPQGRTKQGFDMQIGTNHFGHFALTLKLLPLLKASSDARVVTVSSLAASMMVPKKINWDDYQRQKRKYDKEEVYGISKLFNLMFAFELQDKLEAAGVKNVTSYAAHPGWTRTDLQRHAGLIDFLGKTVAPSMPPEEGCQPQLLPCCDANPKTRVFYGPSGMKELTGKPGFAKVNKLAEDKEQRMKMWRESEKHCKTGFPW